MNRTVYDRIYHLECLTVDRFNDVHHQLHARLEEVENCALSPDFDHRFTRLVHALRAVMAERITLARVLGRGMI